jgi:hypothetical protein
MKKKVKCGLDYLRDANWEPILTTKQGAERLGNKLLRGRGRLDLLVAGFKVSIFETEEYYRINFGK